MSDSQVKVETIVSQLFEENTYLLQLTGRNDCLVVDPGLEPDRIQTRLAELRWTPAAILNTHGHADHIAGNETLKRVWPEVPLVIGAGDADKLSDPVANLSAPFGLSLTSPPADQLVREGDTYAAAGFDLEVLEIPGHSSGHVVFMWRGGEPPLVIAGDVLFAGSVGRSDFPDGDPEALVRGIQQKLFPLPNNTLVLPGHGPTTTIGEEKARNPFVGAPAGYREA